MSFIERVELVINLSYRWEADLAFFTLNED